MSKPGSRPFVALVVLPLALAFAGCSVVDAVAYKKHTTHYADASALAAEWEGIADWVPQDAVEVTVTESTVAGDAVILFASRSELDVTKCAPVTRQSAPAYYLEGAPDVYSMSEVFACGEWTVGDTDDGWFGWTPGHPDEARQSPS